MVDDAARLNEGGDYLPAIKEFLIKCYVYTNKCNSLRKLLDEASGKLPKPKGMSDENFKELTS